MAVLKCKMCGGDLDIQDGSTICECEYCGTKQTIPTLGDDKKISLFARANRLRFACEFDKAAGVYEDIIQAFPEEAEAYWGLILCKYGIEYVDDPATNKKIPTCHRSSFESVMDDSDFEMVMETSDPVSRKLYREEAKAIEELRKNIVYVSSAEKPYDIFICYKETDENGERTIDSVIAQDVYYELTEKGYRVFFSRITLEEKLGQEYEPYIFAALNSAKVMLVFGSDYEYFNAVWVKNEWSRFLKLISKGEKKILIPCYKNIDAYDMPKEFAKLQSQDMGKIGAIQDLLRGVEKILSPNKSAAVQQVQAINNSAIPMVEPLLKRAFLFLEDGDFKSADEYSEKVLDIDPENGYAYLAKLMVACSVTRKEQLVNAQVPFYKNINYQKILRFGSDELKSDLQGYINEISLRNMELVYQRLVSDMAKSDKESELLAISNEFQRMGDYKQAKELSEKCRAKIKDIAEAVEQRRAKIKKMGSNWISCHSNTVCVRAGGTVVATHYAQSDKNYCGQSDVFAWTDIVSVSTGGSHTVGLKADGSVVATKYLGKPRDYHGQCEVSSWSDIVCVSAGANHTVGLKSDGTVVATKYINSDSNDNFLQSDVEGWRDIVAVCAGYDKTVGLKSNGTVVVTGSNLHGSGEVSSWRDIIAISAGWCHTVGLKSNGTVVSTQIPKDGHYKGFGQCNVTGWLNIVSVVAGGEHTVGLKADGTVVATGNNKHGQCNVSEWRDIVAVCAGWACTIGLKSDGTLVATGINANGECNVKGFKLFDSFENLEQEHWRKLEKRRLAEEKRLAIEKSIADEKAMYRAKGRCQYCGGEIKGLLVKKCIECGLPKDY